MGSVNGKSHEWSAGAKRGEFKELTRAPDLHPLGIVETLCFDLPPGEGAPSKVRGLGEFLRRGQGEEFPLWVRAKPVRLAML